jgi:hypothetical protein
VNNIQEGIMEPYQQQLVYELARQVVTQLSPKELPLLRATSQAYFKNPDAVQVDGKDQMLGFGVNNVRMSVSPLALAISSEVIKSMPARPRSETGQAVFPALSPEQMAHARDVAFRKASQFRLSEANAHKLAEAVVVGLSASEG